MPKFTLGKKEKLKSRKIIEELFLNGSSLFSYPIKLVYSSEAALDHYPLKFSTTVSKRNFNKAVDRNLIKRRIREAYRLNNIPLKDHYKEKKQILHMMYIYVGKEILEYSVIEKSIVHILRSLKNES